MAHRKHTFSENLARTMPRSGWLTDSRAYAIGPRPGGGRARPGLGFLGDPRAYAGARPGPLVDANPDSDIDELMGGWGDADSSAPWRR
jgi:hypothetical protein